MLAPLCCCSSHVCSFVLAPTLLWPYSEKFQFKWWPEYLPVWPKIGSLSTSTQTKNKVILPLKNAFLLSISAVLMPSTSWIASCLPTNQQLAYICCIYAKPKTFGSFNKFINIYVCKMFHMPMMAGWLVDSGLGKMQERNCVNKFQMSNLCNWGPFEMCALFYVGLFMEW